MPVPWVLFYMAVEAPGWLTEPPFYQELYTRPGPPFCLGLPGLVQPPGEVHSETSWK